jgi:hypothetical protein
MTEQAHASTQADGIADLPDPTFSNAGGATVSGGG